MARLIQAVLNYSRLSNASTLIETVDLNEIVQNIASDLELIINEKAAVIHTVKLPLITGISLQLNQLFLNLISNALKFSEVKPEISIMARTITGDELSPMADLQAGQRYVELIFKDNGIGFEQQHADKIFTIFQRLHNRKKYAGTGIGLALCKKIVENHHGHISVISEPGKGSSFLCIPALDFELDSWVSPYANKAYKRIETGGSVIFLQRCLPGGL